LIAAAIVPMAFVSAQAPVETPAPRVEPVIAQAPVESESRAVPLRVLAGVPGGVVAGVAEGVAAPDQERSEMSGKIAEVRRQLEVTRDQVATAAQQGAEQSQIEELRKRLAALEAQLARMLVEQRGTESRRMTADEEATLKARQQGIEKESERLKQLYEKGLVSERQMRQAELDKQRALLERTIKERADGDLESQALLKRQLSELQQRDLAVQAERAKTLSEKGLLSQRDAQRAEEALLQRKLADSNLYEEMALAKAALADSALSEDAKKLVSRATDDKATDNDVIDVFKNISNLKEDGERASVLVRIARERPFTAAMVSAYLSAANTIRSDYDRQRVFRQPIKLKAGR
jgi:hypothetical protein